MSKVQQMLLEQRAANKSTQTVQAVQAIASRNRAPAEASNTYQSSYIDQLRERRQKEIASRNALVQQQQALIQKKRQEKEAEKEMARIQQLDIERKQQELLGASNTTPEPEPIRQDEETMKVNNTLFSAIVEVVKLMAVSNKRVISLANDYYDEITEEGSDLQDFFRNVLDNFEKTTDNLMATIAGNLYVAHEEHGSIKDKANSLHRAAATLLSVSRNLKAEDKTNSLNMMKTHVVAISLNIKNLLRELAHLKATDEGSALNLLENDDVLLVDYESQDEEKKQHRATTRDLERQVQVEFTRSKDLSEYDPEKIRELQMAIKKSLLIKRFKGLVSSYNTESKHYERRRRALFEILETETSYLTALKKSVTFWRGPLLEKAASVNWVAQGEVSTIFYLIDEIIELSSKLEAAMKNSLEAWPKNPFFAEIFMTYSEDLKLYSAYVNEFDNTMDTYSELCNREQFKDFQLQCMQSAQSNIDLASILVMPVQRMPRYEILLRELIKQSEKTHPDYLNLIDAKDDIKEINTFINHEKRLVDNQKRLSYLQNHIVSTAPIVLERQGRIILKEGFVALEYKKNKRHQAEIFLFNDHMIICGIKTIKGEPVPHLLATIALDTLRVAKIDDENFELSTKEEEYIIHLEDSVQYNSWITTIQEAIDTNELDAVLDETIKENNNYQSGFMILHGTYGKLGSPKKCKEITLQLQQIVMTQGGDQLILKGEKKSQLFGNPAEGKKKQLEIVFSANGVVKRRTFKDSDYVELNADS
eukprot:TRINITY_DN1841_c0_g1_i1.p1 TRINITY_DN1841_c0_g1~~TRINITY_DN1841_c0_g1_i1.p1  ORF type:complete len:875 (+),score=207.28 TRINITY_DN1841_c0_g1_i1:343-2625(+)